MTSPDPPPAAIENVQAPTARSRLRETFADHDPKDHTHRWDHLWQQNFTPWDQGLPNPALVDLLQNPRDLLPGAVVRNGSSTVGESSSDVVDERRAKALVPGCGRGYDVLLFASHGYDAFGVEGSKTALQACGKACEGYEAREEYRVQDATVGRGNVKFLYGDFFDDAWWEEVEGDGKKEGFDVIYDYTFLCALPPATRPNWAQRMSQLLAPGGRLICLEFPTYKEPSTLGPPWAVRPEFYLAYLSRPGEDIVYGEDAVIEGFDEEDLERTDTGLKRVAHWRPERTHEVGKGTDWISVWSH